jgi:hypothetical protein
MTDDRREGRGRLSSIDTLPEEAEPLIVWALEALRERKMTQAAILDEFNWRLEDLGVPPISKSAFNRWSLRKAFQLKRLDEVRVISSELIANLGSGGAEEVTLAAAEMLKVGIFQVLEGQPDAKELEALARALNAAVAAQKTSADHRKKLEEREAAMVEKVVDRATDAAREAGLGADVVAQMRRDVLGVRA